MHNQLQLTCSTSSSHQSPPCSFHSWPCWSSEYCHRQKTLLLSMYVHRVIFSNYTHNPCHPHRHPSIIHPHAIQPSSPFPLDSAVTGLPASTQPSPPKKVSIQRATLLSMTLLCLKPSHGSHSPCYFTQSTRLHFNIGLKFPMYWDLHFWHRFLPLSLLPML